MAGRLEAPGVLLLFNEVQQFPQARAAIKYLVADGRYLCEETGSLVSTREHGKDIVTHVPHGFRRIHVGY